MSAENEWADEIADEIIRLLQQPNSLDLPEDVRVIMAVEMALEKFGKAYP